MEPVRTRAIRAMLDGHDGVASFDVFDTLLWRRTPRPIDVFHDIPRAAATAGLKLPPVTGVMYASMRRRSESTARARVAEEFGSGEVTLAQIVEQVAVNLGWDVDDRALLEALAAAELAAEAAALVADRELLQLVQDELERGRRMVVVSDSYLAPAHIGSLLTGAGYPADAFERIFVSSSFGASKAAGLFEIVAKELDIHPARILHLGDNVPADVSPLRRLGGRSARWAVARDESIELCELEAGTDELPMRTAIVDGEPTSADAGITALRARLVPPDDMTDARERTLTGYERFGRLVFGPTLVGFANWICSRAAELGMRRLYFFQREGALLSEVVHGVAEAHGQELQTDVLAVSRAALAAGRYSRVSTDYLSDLILARRPRRADEIVAEIGLGERGVGGWTSNRWVRSFDGGELFNLVRADPVRLAVVQDDLDRRRANLHRYLRGAVDLDADQIGVVDLGWAGSIQKSLSLGLTQIGFAGTVRGFYLATNDAAERHLSLANRNEGFIVSLGFPDGFEPVFRNIEVIEQACLEHTGSVLAYDDDGEVVRADDDIAPGQWLAVQRIQDGVRSFLDEWVAHEPPPGRRVPDESDVWRVAVRQILRRFCAEPTRDEVELFRTWRHDDNKGARSTEQMVPAVLQERSSAGAMLASALAMDELLWSSAVATLNGGDLEADPVTVRATLTDIGLGCTVPAITAVGRRRGELVAAYVGAQAQRLGAVTVDIATGPAITTFGRVTVEVESDGESVVHPFTSFREVHTGRGIAVVGDRVAILKRPNLRLTVPLGAIASRLAPEQRVRVLVEVRSENFRPLPSPVARRARAGRDAALRWAVERGAAQAVSMLPAAMNAARAAGGGQVAREAAETVKDAARKLGVIR